MFLQELPMFEVEAISDTAATNTYIVHGALLPLLTDYKGILAHCKWVRKRLVCGFKHVLILIKYKCHHIKRR